METRLDHRRSVCSNFINKVRSRPDQALAQSDDDSVIDGMIFIPTLKLSTPTWILKKSGEVYRGKATPPDYGGEQHGIWAPKLHSDFDIFNEGETAGQDHERFLTEHSTF